jgi:hypothetical protein
MNQELIKGLEIDYVNTLFKQMNWTQGAEYCYYCANFDVYDHLVYHVNMTGAFSAWPASISMMTI